MLKEAEEEIKRLTKTVKIVEIETKEDTKPFKDEINRLLKDNSDLQTMLEKSSADHEAAKLRVTEVETTLQTMTVEMETLRSEKTKWHSKMDNITKKLTEKISTIDQQFAQQKTENRKN
jgi:uncharacterized protein YoxC